MYLSPVAGSLIPVMQRVGSAAVQMVPRRPGEGEGEGEG
jgi:hypothetical protein